MSIQYAHNYRVHRGAENMAEGRKVDTPSSTSQRKLFCSVLFRVQVLLGLYLYLTQHCEIQQGNCAVYRALIRR